MLKCLGLLGFLLVAGCGGDNFAPAPTPSREQARNDAVTTFCTHANACGNIGAGKTYSSLDNCTVQLTAFMDGV